MKRVVILGQSEVTCRALGAWCELLGWANIHDDSRKDNDDSRVETIVYQRAVAYAGGEAGVWSFEDLLQRIERAVADESCYIPLNQVTVMVDAVNLKSLNPVCEGENWEGLIAMLILALPEVHWVFGVLSGIDTDEQSEFHKLHQSIKNWHTLSTLLACPRRDGIFDGSGLRYWVRQKGKDVLKNQTGSWLPQRKLQASAMDEEKPYAYLHGYTAYRFGYRADAIYTWSLAEALLNKTNAPSQPSYKLAMEDMSLNFPDRRDGIHLLDLRKRADFLDRLDSTDGALEQSDHRILITTGQGQSQYRKSLAKNRAYLKAKSIGKGRVVMKPASGMYGLWHEAGLMRKRKDCMRVGDAEGFVWPPGKQEEEDSAGSAHGAPGRLLLVAEALVKRARRIYANEHADVTEDLCAAVLATDAMELLGTKTPTLASQALLLKHCLETRAESHFPGVEHHVTMAQRAEELEIEAKAIARNFQAKEQENARLNILLSVANELVKLLRAENQYDEEGFWMAKSRHWHNRLWLRAGTARWIWWPFLRYTEFLLSSFRQFFACIAAWIVGLTVLFTLEKEYLAPVAVNDEELQTFGQAVSSFFGGELFTSHEPLWVAPTLLAMLAGISHLGIFISQLYSITTRK